MILYYIVMWTYSRMNSIYVNVCEIATETIYSDHGMTIFLFINGRDARHSLRSENRIVIATVPYHCDLYHTLCS